MDLTQYVTDIETLEKERYGMECTIGEIDRIIGSLGIANSIKRKTNSIPEDDTHFGIGRTLVFLFALVWGGLGIYFWTVGPKFGGRFLLFFILPAIGLICWIIGYTVKSRNEYQENQSIIERQYAQEIDADRKRVEREEQMALCYKKARNKMYETYCKTKTLLDQMYGLNVIYGKYRYDLVAICMFAEYFQSGRCTSLEGHEGAYNIYESEIRLGTIINRLDEIIVRLDRIERNQYGLFMAITEVSKQQTKILSNLNTMSRQLDVQNENLEYIGYDLDVMRINTRLALTYGLLYN